MGNADLMGAVNDCGTDDGRDIDRSGLAVSGEFRVTELRRFGRFAMVSVHAAAIAERAEPGQFVMVRVPVPDFHLRRPFSIHSVSVDCIRLLIEPRGAGSSLLADVGVGDSLAVVGPIGSGFPLEGVRSALLVGGGIGAVPLQFLADRLVRASTPVVAAFGFKDSAQARLEGAFDMGDLWVATEDGSIGLHGTALDLLEQVEAPADATVFGCGPRPMLGSLSTWVAARGLSGYASLEAHMACGAGACQGCVIATAEGQLRVCVDGPVFSFETLRAHP